MAELYTLQRTSNPDEFLVKKFDADHNWIEEYTVTKSTCSGPDGHRANCIHRQMVPLFLADGHVNDGFFLNWDTRMWQGPIWDPEPTKQELADREMLNNRPMIGITEEEYMAQKLAAAHESEGSALVRVEQITSIELTAAAHSSSTSAVQPPPARPDLPK
jgi:hypothetical protein